jgi:phage shock protein A
MSILQKILTLFRGTATEAGQAIVDKNAIRILDQEMRDAQNELLKSRDDLTKIMAQRNLSEKKLGDKQKKAAEYEGYIKGALLKGDEALARDVAQKLAPIEAEIATDRQMIVSYDDSIRALHTAIRGAESNLARLKQQVDTVRVTESVQRAQSAIAARHSGTNSKMRNALDSLERVKERQLEQAARLDAAHQLASSDGDSELRARLQQAGLVEDTSSADSILDRFRVGEARLVPPERLAHEPTASVDSVSEAEKAKVPRQ